MDKMIAQPLQGFLDFVREQGVMGLAIGFILGTAISKAVASFVQDVLEPVISIFFGSAGPLGNWMIGPIKIGAFISSMADFLIIAVVVYVLFIVLRVQKLDIKKM